LSKEALAIIPDSYIQQIRQYLPDRPIELHPTLGLLLRTELGLWQRKVEDEHGQLIHPDDVSLAILRAINTGSIDP
jgi:hypothetical protein